MTAKITAPYGTWVSPLSTQLLTQDNVGFADVALLNGSPLWTEGRPWESGRTVLCTLTDGITTDKIPNHLNVRTRVHEYGGGAMATGPDGCVWFNDVVTGQVHVLGADGTVHQITHTPEGKDIRYADFCPDVCGDHKRGNGAYCITEIADNGQDAPKHEPINALCYIDRTTGNPTIIHKGHDFYTTPVLSFCGQKLAFATWNHPHMPWDSCVVWLAHLAKDGTIDSVEHIAGGDTISALHPCFAPDGTLHYVSDAQGWWQIYAHSGNGADTCLTPHAAEYGLPHWVFGMRTYGFTDGGNIIVTRHYQGAWQIGQVQNGNFVAYDTPFASFDGLRIEGETAIFIAGHPSKAPMVATLNTTTGDIKIIKQSADDILTSADVSIAQPITYSGTAGDVHAYYYAPVNAQYQGNDGEKPPLLVRSHGGPTAQVNGALDLKKIQFWTTRGFAVLDVNYSGSTGYGREYRNRLLGQWGILDVDDCVNGALHLVRQGLVDADRLLITGGSAGGYTTLCALAFRDVFKAGCSAYGIGDLTALAQDTHKFESRYLDGLIGVWPKQADIYRQRSPLESVDTLNCPVIFLQGEDDKVVPPNQAEKMVDALNAKGIATAYILFAGEGHGFRQAKNVRKALESELSFYGQVFGFPVAGDFDPVIINNKQE